jgi:hypothetical protein
MWGHNLLVVLPMLAKLIVREEEFGNEAGLGSVRDAGFAQPPMPKR